MFDQRDAILKLLSDDDPSTVRLVKEQLAGGGPEIVAGLTDLLSTDNLAAARHVRDVLGEIDSREACNELDDLCRLFPANGDLEDASWILARALLPGCNFESARRQIDHWGERLAQITRGILVPLERVQLMADFLANGLNFCGHSEDYYHPFNSLLPKLVETRLGIPISLTLLYMMVGRRAGIEVVGVNFPGHFLARHRQVLFDPFERGRILSSSDCEAILHRQKLTWQPEYFKTATPLAMFTRIVANLLYVYQSAQNEAVAERINGWLRSLTKR